MNKLHFLLCSLAASIGLCGAALAATPPNPAAQTALPRIALGEGLHAFNVQVADTVAQHEIGLMHRESMPQREGMLFVFESAGKQCFWMKNTLIPLSAAFLADDGTIINLEDMAPLTTEPHCSAAPARYVLEMNRGWFGKNGYAVGSKISGGPFSH